MIEVVNVMINRFCPEKYHPFDSKIVDKYVIGDDYLPTWKIPSLKKYFTDGGFSMKDSFDAYLREIGKEPENVWRAVKSAIQEVYLRTERSMVSLLTKYKTKRTYFEMVRFDFVIDEDLNVFIMEVSSMLHFRNLFPRRTKNTKPHFF